MNAQPDEESPLVVIAVEEQEERRRFPLGTIVFVTLTLVLVGGSALPAFYARSVTGEWLLGLILIPVALALALGATAVARHFADRP